MSVLSGEEEDIHGREEDIHGSRGGRHILRVYRVESWLF
jgi:hypothetical protein